MSDTKTSRPLNGILCSVASLGCPKNLVDSETMVGRLTALGATFTNDCDRVDFFLLNTCGFLRSARDEAEEYIASAVEEKRVGNIRFLLVAGCAVVSDGKELAEKYPTVDAWISPYDELKLGEIALALLNDEQAPVVARETSASTDSNALRVLAPEEVAAAKFHCNVQRNLTLDDSQRVVLTQPSVAYLKIADGCDRFCSYCSIPHIRGRYVSKTREAILDEAARLADSGVQELALIAQETTFWGADLYGAPALKDLLATLKEKNLFHWIRVMYAYPLFWDSELTSLFKIEEDPEKTSIIPYVDLPLQHCNSELLGKMNRKVDRAQTEELLAKLREEIPDLVLRTSFITGFPGETDAMHQELLDFLEKWRFERAGIFQFSPEPNTPAQKMDDQVPERVKQRRFERLYAKQEKISHQFARSFIGKTIDVHLDSRAIADGGSVMRNVCIGRTYADAPDVDPVVYVTGRDLEVGSFLSCEVVDAHDLDLIAVPNDPEKIFVSKEERRAKARAKDRDEGGKKRGKRR